MGHQRPIWPLVWKKYFILYLTVLFSFPTVHFNWITNRSNWDQGNSGSLWIQCPSLLLSRLSPTMNHHWVTTQIQVLSNVLWIMLMFYEFMLMKPNVFRNLSRLQRHWLLTYLTSVSSLSPNHASPKHALRSSASTRGSQPVIFSMWILYSSLCLFFEGIARRHLHSSQWFSRSWGHQQTLLALTSFAWFPHPQFL